MTLAASPGSVMVWRWRSRARPTWTRSTRRGRAGPAERRWGRRDAREAGRCDPVRV